MLITSAITVFAITDTIGTKVSWNYSTYEHGSYVPKVGWAQPTFYNAELSEVVLDDIMTTITFSKSMNAAELEAYVKAYDINIVQLQARGYDKDGNRITFFSRTDKGLEETFRLLSELANSDEVVLAGAIGVYALTSSSSVRDIQNDKNTLLIDSSADQYYNDDTAVSGYERNATSSPDEEKNSFANSIAWDAEELGLVYYEVQ